MRAQSLIAALKERQLSARSKMGSFLNQARFWSKSHSLLNIEAAAV
jgi:hypothetical protein